MLSIKSLRLYNFSFCKSNWAVYSLPSCNFRTLYVHFVAQSSSTQRSVTTVY